MWIEQSLAGLAFAAALFAASAAGAFETTTINGTNPDGTAHYQDPDDQKPTSELGGFQFGVKGSGFNDTSNDDSGAPPWQLKPTPPSQGFFSSPYGSSSFPR